VKGVEPAGENIWKISIQNRLSGQAQRIGLTVAAAAAAKPAVAAHRVTSPDGRVQVVVQGGQGLTYCVGHDGVPLLLPSRLGLSFSDGLKLGETVQVVDVATRTHDASWTDDFGKFSTVKDTYRELRVRLRELRPVPVAFDVLVRVYNDGVALRYVLPKQAGLDAFTLTEDRTEFLFAGDHQAWVGAHTGYENQFPEIRLSQMSGDRRSLPLVVAASNDTVAVAEADVRDWSGLSLVAAGVPDRFGVRAALISSVTAKTPCQSSWHALVIGRTAGELTVSTMLKNLATPSQIADTSWIKPGLMAWDAWWTGVNPHWDKYKGLEARGNTQSHKDYIDLAAEMGWPYMLVDWYWYDQEGRDPETAIRPLEHIDMPGLMAYAKAKGVRLVLWVNSKNIGSIGMDKLFSTYAGWGAAGVKIDFFQNNGSQATQRWQEELLACAAKHRLFIDFHGTYTPTGLSRTWPNLLTQEGVLGNEYAKLGRDYTPAHMVRLPFTRGLLGLADVTPGAFVNRTEATFRPNAVPCEVMGTRCSQLALSVLMDSPLLCLCDSPANYRGQPGFEFYRGLPTTWDETRVLSDDMAEHLVQARRKGNAWWIAGMNNRRPLTLRVKLDFLGRGKYTLRTFADTPESAARPAVLAESSRTVTRDDTVEIRMETAGGFAADIKPVGGLQGDK